MKWKRVTNGEDALCAARGCTIPAGQKHWQARWKSENGAAQEARYCEECGAGSQAHPGDTLYGVWGSLLLAVVFLVVLPLAWPHRWPLWVALFVAAYASVAVISTRLFLKIYPNRRPRESEPVAEVVRLQASRTLANSAAED
jgi:hypothetical protein